MAPPITTAITTIEPATRRSSWGAPAASSRANMATPEATDTSAGPVRSERTGTQKSETRLESAWERR